MALAAGRLRERITIRRLGDVATGKGGFTRGWETVATVWAEVVNQSGREAIITNTLQGIATYRIIIRFREDLEAGMQILWRGKELNILAPPADPEGRREITQILADTSSPQGA